MTPISPLLDSNLAGLRRHTPRLRLNLLAGPYLSSSGSRADVEAILAKLADGQDEDYDWKRSIVDLMKLLKLDSGLWRPKAVGAGARLYRRPQWLGGNERLAAQAGHDQAR